MIRNSPNKPLGFVIYMLGLVSVAVFAVACNNILDVQRPTLITEDQVARDSALIKAVAQGAIEPFRNEYAWIAHAGGGQSD